MGSLRNKRKRHVQFEKDYERLSRRKRAARRRNRREAIMNYVVGPGLVAVGVPIVAVSMPLWAPLLIYAMIKTD